MSSSLAKQIVEGKQSLQDSEINVTDDVPAIVIDNGSSHIKSGFAGQKCMTSIVPSIIGRLRYPEHLMGLTISSTWPDHFVGQDAIQKRGILRLKYPFQNDIDNWEDVELIWHHIFDKELKINLMDSQHPLLMTQYILASDKDKAKMKEIVFEKFNVPYFHTEPQQLLSLYASGHITGLVTHSGYRCTQVVPIYDGQCLLNCITELSIGGEDVSDFTFHISRERGYAFITTSEQNSVIKFKEKDFYVAMDYEKELQKFDNNPLQERTWTLPDGSIVVFGNERFRSTELMFKPKYIGLEQDGIDVMIINSLMKCDMKIRKELCKNIFLCGGNMHFEGMKERLYKELGVFYDFLCKRDVLISGYWRRCKLNCELYGDIQKLIDKHLDCSKKFKSIPPNDDNVLKIHKENAQYSAWLGGSILASLPTFKELCVSKAEYDEIGANSVHGV